MWFMGLCKLRLRIYLNLSHSTLDFVISPVLYILNSKKKSGLNDFFLIEISCYKKEHTKIFKILCVFFLFLILSLFDQHRPQDIRILILPLPRAHADFFHAISSRDLSLG